MIIDRLGTIRTGLAGIADSLAAHLPPRYTPVPPQDRATVLARAQDFERTGQALPTAPDGTPNEVTALLAEAHRARQAPDSPAWDLAVSATTLRARLGAAAPPVLIEAVAFLQDLAIKQAPPGERAAFRRWTETGFQP